MNIIIRRAVPEEANILSQIAFAAKAYWGYPERWLEIWKPQLTFDAGFFVRNESWVAEVEEKPVAFHTLIEKGGNAWIENLWVLPMWMGKGVGKQMFLHAVARSREAGYVSLQLEADPNAVGFYEKMGMRKIGERRSDVEGELRVLPVMEMRL
jgi:ribosomal protein S18 acetylase RimI-like enzyme